MKNLIASSMLNNIVDRIVNNIFSPTMLLTHDINNIVQDYIMQITVPNT